jgi:hypothetical protein
MPPSQARNKRMLNTGTKSAKRDPKLARVNYNGISDSSEE